MEHRQQTCQEHGGVFMIEKKRGRPPTKCSPANQCAAVKPVRNTTITRVANARAAKTATSARKPSRAAQATAERVQQQTGRQVKAQRGSSAVATEPVVSNNPSVPLAFAAKRLLEPQGWQLKGSKWEDGEGKFANILGQRGSETITFLWRDGKLIDQQYSMWDGDTPHPDGMPRKRLDFDPNELSDAALIKRLSGKKIAWWNTLGKYAERTTFPRSSDNRVKVEHLMNGHGDNEVRVVSFVDQAGTGFRSFNVEALLAVR